MSLLVLFMLIAVTYVVTAGQSHTTAKYSASATLNEINPQFLLNSVLYDLLRDTTNTASTLRGHSLLRDMYGDDYVKGTILATTAPQETMNGQFIEFDVRIPGIARWPGYYAGRVLTITSGPAAGLSTRIVYFVATPSTTDRGRFRVMNFPTNSDRRLNLATPTATVFNDLVGTTAPDDQATVLINGVPFNGTGAGFDPSAQRLNSLALLPDMRVTSDSDWNTYKAGGLDEGYDAVDYQNMFLAGLIPDPADGNRLLGVIPSFYRPALVNYHVQAGTSSSAYRMLAPGLPNIAKYDPSTNAFPWHVDNDGDLLPDSVWIDPGLPINTTPDGRRYKVLAAILCTDLDNRLNVNAHGTLEQAEYQSQPYRKAHTAQWAGGSTSLDLPPGQGFGPAEMNMTSILSKADLLALLQGNQATNVPGRYGTFGEFGCPSSSNPPRPGIAYAMDMWSELKFWHVPRLYADFTYSIPNYSSSSTAMQDWFLNVASNPDVDQVFNDASVISRIYTTGNYSNSRSQKFLTSYFSPPDLRGQGFYGLDLSGHPLTPRMGIAFSKFDNPYEIDLSYDGNSGTSRKVTKYDTPFTAAELERVLRQGDRDAGAIPDRLITLARDLLNHRFEVTTDSFDPPVPSIQANQDIYLFGPDGQSGTSDDLSGNRTHLSILDLFAYRLKKEDPAFANLAWAVHQLLPTDLLMGVRFDVNRPVGNGRDSDAFPFDHNTGMPDDHGGFIVDEPLESLDVNDTRRSSIFNGSDVRTQTPEYSWASTGGYRPQHSYVVNYDSFSENNLPSFNNAPADFLNDDPVIVERDQVRQVLARHLYVLMLLLHDEGYIDWTTGESGLSAAQKRELTTRRIAQWAVNCVDYRDADSIMTAFEYDVNPFKIDTTGGVKVWEVDGDLRSTSTDNSASHRRVVWGCEYPELLITETVAGHDLRTQDLANETPSPAADPVGLTSDPIDSNDLTQGYKDDDFDQKLIPKGWAFIELYNTRTHNDVRLPREFYATDGKMRLDKLAPGKSYDNLEYPIWRLAISRASSTGSGTPKQNDVTARLAGKPWSMSLEPNDPSLLPAASDPVEIERLVWFRPLISGCVDSDKIYHNQTGSLYATTYQENAPQLAPGQYALVCPFSRLNGSGEHKLRIGFESDTADSAPQEFSYYASNNKYHFTFNDNRSDNDYTYPAASDDPATVPADIKRPLVMRVGRKVSSWSLEWHSTHRGEAPFSISEPVFSDSNYYPRPNSTWTDPRDSVQWNNYEVYSTPHDQPLDNANPNIADLGADPRGTYENFKTVFLQRLANPVRPWNPEKYFPGTTTVNPAHNPQEPINPYLTVDRSPIDLTVYNSMDHALASNPNTNLDPRDQALTKTEEETLYRFSSRERGKGRYNNDSTAAADVPFRSNFWAQTFEPPVRAAGTPYSYTNPNKWGTATDPEPDHHFPHLLHHTLGYVNSTFQNSTGTRWRKITTANHPEFIHRGEPTYAKAWLPWLNRPYVSETELVNVPASSPARLLWEYSLPSGPQDVYTTASGVYSGPFGHLLNFFQSGTQTTPGPNYHRIFEYLRTPSPFAHTETYFHPGHFSSGSYDETGGIWKNQHFRFQPPFNFVSTYRDPGKINLNTVFSENVWNAFLNGENFTTFPELVDSRRDFGSAGAGILAMNDNFPTYFANPFRSAGASRMVPLSNLEQTQEVDATIFRSNKASSSPEPLFQKNSTAEYNDTDRASYFRYKGYQKLGNMTTTRSNVFAVWITIGFFEVDSAGNVVSEIGSDLGDMKRHRAFYLIDRTIPVGFEPGMNHNVDKAIVTRKFIE